METKLRRYLTETFRGRILMISMKSTVVDFLREHFENIVDCKWTDIVFEEDILIRGESLGSYNFVIVGYGDHINMASTVINYLKLHNIRYLCYGKGSNETSKISQNSKFEEMSIPQPKTIISSKMKTSSEELFSKLGLPVVVKSLDTARGEGVSKIDKRFQLDKFLSMGNKEDFFIFQEFIPNDGDIRVFFFRGQILYSIKRKSSSPKEFRNNISLGGKQEYIDKLPPEVEDLAIKVDRIFNLDFAGVDIVQNKKTGEWLVFEINPAPQFFGDEKYVIPVIIDYINRGNI
jgi:RimK family alpha-L-glutamate ligase